MSAQAHLAGLYPPVGDQVWNDQLLWQPIPIHTLPGADDIIIAQTTSDCDKYNRLYKELLESADIQDLYKQNEDLFQYVREYTKDNITSFGQLSYLYDTFYVEKQNNLTLPEWAEDIYERLANLSILGMALSSWTPDLARLKAGRLIYEVLNHFDKVSAGDQLQKFKMYSAHDSTLVNVLSALGVFDGLWPLYTSMILFELKNNGTDTYVDVLYKRGGEEIRDISFDICGFNCSIDEMKETLEKVLISSDAKWLNECNS